MVPTRSLLAALVVLLSVSGCHKNPPAQTRTQQPPQASAQPAGANPQAGPKSSASFAEKNKTATGTVEETIDAAGYTYLRLKTDQGDTWAVVPQASLQKGAPVTVAVQMVSRNFHSKTLNRDFDTLLFGLIEGSQTTEAPQAQPSTGALPPGHPALAAPAASGAPEQGKDATEKEADEALGGGVAEGPTGKIAKATSANGRTVAELWAQRKALAGKQVAVHGKVVKYLPGIMGKNWLHLRDGSGSAADKTDDLTVTTQESVKPGEVVTATGTVVIDKDYGAGYAYPVILEQAKIQK